jgi:hypothetical protein
VTEAVTTHSANTILAANDTVAYTVGLVSIPNAGVALVIVGIVYLLRNGRSPLPPNSPPQDYPPQHQHLPNQVWPQQLYPPPGQHYPNYP